MNLLILSEGRRGVLKEEKIWVKQWPEAQLGGVLGPHCAKSKKKVPCLRRRNL